jgi:hypothetical protein
MIVRLFTDHPRTVGESYFEHMGSAGSFGSRMVFAGCACLLHGLFPFVFVKTGSNAIRQLHREMVSNRARHPAAPEWADMGAHI